MQSSFLQLTWKEWTKGWKKIQTWRLGEQLILPKRAPNVHFQTSVSKGTWQFRKGVFFTNHAVFDPTSCQPMKKTIRKIRRDILKYIMTYFESPSHLFDSWIDCLLKKRDVKVARVGWISSIGGLGGLLSYLSWFVWSIVANGCLDWFFSNTTTCRPRRNSRPPDLLTVKIGSRNPWRRKEL